jgi:hypothetical protein
MKPRLHTNLFSSAIEGHVSAFELGVMQSCNLHDICGDLFCGSEFIRDVSEMSPWRDNVALVCEAICEGVVHSPAVNVRDQDTCGARDLGHGGNEQPHSASAKNNSSITLLYCSPPASVNCNRERLQKRGRL